MNVNPKFAGCYEIKAVKQDGTVLSGPSVLGGIANGFSPDKLSEDKITKRALEQFGAEQKITSLAPMVMDKSGKMFLLTNDKLGNDLSECLTARFLSNQNMKLSDYAANEYAGKHPNKKTLEVQVGEGPQGFVITRLSVLA